MTDAFLKNIAKYNLIIGAGYILLSFIFWSLPKTMGLALGVLIMTVNFSIMVFIFRNIFSKGRIRKLSLVIYTVKFLILAATIYLIFQLNWVNKLFFIFGTTVILASLIAATMVSKGADEGNLQE